MTNANDSNDDDNSDKTVWMQHKQPLQIAAHASALQGLWTPTQSHYKTIILFTSQRNRIDTMPTTPRLKHVLNY